MNRPPLDPPPLPAHILEEIEEALAPMRALLPPELIEVMREQLVEGMTEHPYGRALVEQSRPRTAPDMSGDQPTNVEEVAATAAVGKRAGTNES